MSPFSAATRLWRNKSSPSCKMGPTNTAASAGSLKSRRRNRTGCGHARCSGRRSSRRRDVAINGRPMARCFPSSIPATERRQAGGRQCFPRRQRALNITPVQTEENGQKGYRLGFHSEPMKPTSFPAASFQSLKENKRYSLLMVDLVQKLVENKASIKQMDGPIGIARASGDAARQPGWTPLLSLMAMISLNLGIVNLLPIPILDGGIILLLIVEGADAARYQPAHQGADLPDRLCFPRPVASS